MVHPAVVGVEMAVGTSELVGQGMVHYDKAVGWP